MCSNTIFRISNVLGKFQVAHVYIYIFVNGNLILNNYVKTVINTALLKKKNLITFNFLSKLRDIVINRHIQNRYIFSLEEIKCIY